MKALMRCSGGLLRRQHLVQPIGEAQAVEGGGGGQDVFLAREVAVEGAPGDVGRLGDLPHAEPAHAAPPDQARVPR